MANELPLLMEPEDLLPRLGERDLLLVDLCKETTYRQLHLPGAIHLPYNQITASSHPTHGLLPEPAHLERLFSACGIGNQTRVVAYDDEGGGNASRLLWTLEVMGHEHGCLLNGGLPAWTDEGYPIDQQSEGVPAAKFRPQPTTAIVAEAAHILQRLGAEDLALWDARSLNEYRGLSCFARHPGHIPGARHLDWQELMDHKRQLRLKPAGLLRERLSDLGITPEKEVITYCQTHHRSSLAWFVLKYLGYPRARGYPGSWSDWGNRDDTPKETT